MHGNICFPIGVGTCMQVCVCILHICHKSLPFTFVLGHVCWKVVGLVFFAVFSLDTADFKEIFLPISIGQNT